MEEALRRAVFIAIVACAVAAPATNSSRAVATTKCPSAGIFCLDCETLALCVDVGGQFNSYTTQVCSESIGWCSQSLKTCSTKKSYCYDMVLPQRKFLCQGDGTFPDPYDCNVYHDCTTPADPNAEDWLPTLTHVCEAGKAYNYATGVCDLSDSHPTCSVDGFPVPRACGIGLDGGPLPLDTRFYWMCLNTIIRIFKCQDGYVFNAALYKCVSDGQETEEPSTTPGPSVLCPDTGRQPDPADCGHYYDCSDPINPKRRSCSLGKYYNQKTKKCKLGFCPYPY